MLVGEECISILELNFSSNHRELHGIYPVDICSALSGKRNFQNFRTVN